MIGIPSIARKALHKPRFDIRKAIKKPGQLHRDLHIAQGKKIPLRTLHQAAKQPGKIGQRARFALTLSKFRKK